VSTEAHTPENGDGAEVVPDPEDEVIVEGTVVEEDVGIVPLTAADLGIDLPDDPDEANRVLLAEVAAARRDAHEYLDNLQRVAAEFDNFRRRTLRERTDLSERASQAVVERLLPVLDSFDAAFTHDAQTPTEEKLLGGMRSTFQQLFDLLQKEGLEAIPAGPSEPFDPEVHEAVSSAATGDGAPVVAQELRRGYRLKGRVIRPALVAVDHA
jgi:molecular chaperone GrpE